jgi:hypothetical protein
MPISHLLAPLQQIMLQDSLESGQSGVHVEQLEIVFHQAIPAARMEAAWATLVTRTEVLRMAFDLPTDAPYTWQLAKKTASFIFPSESPASFKNWLEQDRDSLLLFPDTPPWRAIYWESRQRFIWTFHHALLDGRSITALISRFLELLLANQAPPECEVTRWTPPDVAMLSKAKDYFQKSFHLIPHQHSSPPPCCIHPKQVADLDQNLAQDLATLSRQLEVSIATLLLWAWAQAVARVAGMDFAFIEQVRCGSPQDDRLGFSMNTLPLLIPRCSHGDVGKEIQALRKDLLFLREIETIAPGELPLEVQELALSPWAGVVMIENSTLESLGAAHPAVRSIMLHESPGASLTAGAFLSPDLRLEVEGPANQELLQNWVDVLGRLKRQCTA